MAKINWSDLIEETKKFVAKNWPSVASEYVGRSCGRVQITDPFSGDNFELGARAKRAIDVEPEAPKPFKTYRDSKLKDYKEFLLNAEGDYNEKENRDVESYYKKG